MLQFFILKNYSLLSHIYLAIPIQRYKNYSKKRNIYTTIKQRPGNQPGKRSLPEDEIDRQYQTNERSRMVPMERFALEGKRHNGGEDTDGDYLLQHLQLHQGERSSHDLGTDTVGRNHEEILQQSDSPTEENDKNQRPIRRDLHLLQLQITIPCEGHKDVRHHQQKDG